MEPRTIELHYDEATARAIASRQWRRAVLPRVGPVLAFIVVPLGFAWVNGDRTWFVGLMGGLAFFLAVLLVASRRSYRIATVERVSRLDDGIVRMTLREEGVEFDSRTSTIRCAWADFTALWCYPDQWVLVYGARQPMVLPARDIDTDAEKRILAALRASRARIHDRR